MTKLALCITEETTAGKRKSLRAGGDDSRALVINLSSEQRIVGCLILQYDDSGRPVITLRKEWGFDCRTQSFAQTKLSQYEEVERYVRECNSVRPDG
jgi:hypothetical protein